MAAAPARERWELTELTESGALFPSFFCTRARADSVYACVIRSRTGGLLFFVHTSEIFARATGTTPSIPSSPSQHKDEHRLTTSPIERDASRARAHAAHDRAWRWWRRAIASSRAGVWQRSAGGHCEGIEETFHFTFRGHAHSAICSADPRNHTSGRGHPCFGLPDRGRRARKARGPFIRTAEATEKFELQQEAQRQEDTGAHRARQCHRSPRARGSTFQFFGGNGLARRGGAARRAAATLLCGLIMCSDARAGCV